MPCNKLAVQAAQLTLTPALLSQTFSTPTALKALADSFEQLIGTSLEGTGQQPVSVWNDRQTWTHGYSARCERLADHQTIPLDAIASNGQVTQYIDICSEDVAFRIYKDGRVEARDSWRVGYQHPQIETFLAQFTQILGQVAVLVAQQMVTEAITGAGIPITNDTRTPQARILTVNI